MKSTPIRLYEAGFRPLVSVIPPNAPLSPLSRIQPNQRGKSPGRRNANGTWGGYDWLRHEITPADVRAWADAGANIGLLAAAFPGVDIDTLDPWLSAEVATVARRVLGPAPSRVGKAPKQLLMYRAREPFARMACIIHKGDQKHLVEVLGAGRQYLIYGTHPTGTAYAWDRDLTTLNPERDLSWVTAAQVARFFEVLGEHLAPLDWTVERIGDGAIRERTSQPQADLLAPSIAVLQEAVDLIPNTDDLFPGREDYVKFGYAVKASAGEADDEAGFEVFASWCARHETDGRVEGNPDTWRSDWRKMHAPYSVGWGWIADLAAPFGFDKAKHDFDPVESIKDREADDNGPPRYSDQWLADRVLEDAGTQLRYVAAYGKWYVWNAGRWQPDAVLLADHLIGSALRRQAALVLRIGATEQQQRLAIKLADQFCSAAKLAAVRTLLRADPRCAAPASAFDSDPWLLNTPAGIVDLKTGLMVDHDPERMCSRQTVVAPDAEHAAPEWQRFLDEATAGDVYLQLYLQRLAGYALTGVTSEQQLTFIWGPGGNGKSVFANALQFVLGDYAETAPMDTFTASAHDRHPTDLAGLVGARLVVASETQAGRRWDEQRLKAMTGGDPVRARYMRQDFFTFTPQFTLMFVGNHKPEITNVDEALRRRIHMVPFTVQPREVDVNLGEKLRAEAPAILAWMIQGCLRWQETGLTPPQAVAEATAEYFEDEDGVGRFLAERCERDPAAVTPMDELYRAWNEWSNARGERQMSIKQLSQLLVSHQLERVRDSTLQRRSAMRGVRMRPEVFPGEEN